LSEKFDSNLIVKIKVSYYLVTLLATVHLGGAVLAGMVPLHGFLKTGLWALLAVSAVHAIRLHGLRTASRAVMSLELDSQGLCSVRLGQDEIWWPAEITRSLMHPWLVMLVLKLADRPWRVSLVIPADAVEAEVFRRLRSRLRLQTRAA
jgi:hypothetical protein